MRRCVVKETEVFQAHKIVVDMISVRLRLFW